jgi:hypothetical protein
MKKKYFFDQKMKALAHSENLKSALFSATLSIIQKFKNLLKFYELL